VDGEEISKWQVKWVREEKGNRRRRQHKEGTQDRERRLRKEFTEDLRRGMVARARVRLIERQRD